ncbi:50S ribosomal protein L24 [Candidatus Woesearchaeota archaeon]|nr:50S ribosomal protein L24 [Candidatus Woesearchaeota archaeon]
MTKRKFSKNWKQSAQARKQRKYRFNAPLHIKQKFMHVHLSKELRAKHGTRAIQLRKGDKVKVTRGQYNKKEGKVDHINLKRERVYIVGLEMIKKSGSKVQLPFHPSNLVIVDLELSGDKYRKEKLENIHKSVNKKEDKAAKKVVSAGSDKNMGKKVMKDEGKIFVKKSIIKN